MSFAPKNSKPVVLPPLPLPPASEVASFRDAARTSALLSKLAQPKSVRRKVPTVPPLSSSDRRSAASLQAPSGQRIIDDYALAGTLHQSSSTGTELHAAQHNLTAGSVVLKAADRRLLLAAGCVPMAQTTPLHSKLEHDHIVRLHEAFDTERFVQVDTMHRHTHQSLYIYTSKHSN